MACTDFQADYYNNIAAVAVVLLFAKVVGRRLSRASHGDWLAVLHAAAVLAAGTVLPDVIEPYAASLAGAIRALTVLAACCLVVAAVGFAGVVSVAVGGAFRAEDSRLDGGGVGAGDSCSGGGRAAGR